MLPTKFGPLIRLKLRAQEMLGNASITSRHVGTFERATYAPQTPYEEGLGGHLLEINKVLSGLAHSCARSVLKPESRMLGCMDEGVCHTSIALGGSGLVLAYFAGLKAGATGVEAIDAGIQYVVQICRSEVDTVSYHDACGAAAVVYGFLTEGERSRFENSDGLGRWYVTQLSRQLDKPVRHDDRTHMSRPQDRHPARLVFYTGTPQFHVDDIIPRAAAFTISRGVLNRLDDQVLSHRVGTSLLELVCNIALGEQGLGAEIDVWNPFLVIPIGGSLMGHEALTREAHAVAGTFEGKIAVLPGFDMTDLE
jgi:hypothetical protein